ncbi:MAG: glycosyltransferase family 2 protein [Proteobacteria bacterium]|nr:glycosyltransferase family 2 protein [Pseudomonadota bacterium]
MISVVIPAWNAAETLAETLASVAAQSVRASETIVVDDGSTDATAEIAHAAGAVVIAQANQGPAAAMNAGVAAARGRMIAFLDADDVWPAAKLAHQQAALADDAGLDGVFGHVACFADPALDGRLHVPEGAAPGWLAGTLLVRRTALLDAGGFDPSLRAGAFIDWVDRARRRGLRFAMLPETLLHRRIRAGSLSARSALRDAAYVAAARAAILRRRAGSPA